MTEAYLFSFINSTSCGSNAPSARNIGQSISLQGSHTGYFWIFPVIIYPMPFHSMEYLASTLFKHPDLSHRSAISYISCAELTAILSISLKASYSFGHIFCITPLLYDSMISLVVQVPFITMTPDVSVYMAHSEFVWHRAERRSLDICHIVRHRIRCKSECLGHIEGI